ncbi:uncharacterized protein LOC125201252 [Salvia hispanica]|uniref:uncharacterized protein LOC125201252 n=1 Tax=Salvia hispanica TaxID=49212 RepID=UPI0020091EDC|nr:uncharacterized protein LOC125201252 [Salvia hispanica]
MATLKDLAAHGWKADNDFRSGYLVRCREAINREFPKTDILPHPHVYSKMTTWKRNYGSLKMMLNFSGIGFNSDGKYKIECDDESWAQFFKKDNNARYMRNKSWPQYEDWKEVFGVDRADSERGADVAASADKIYGQKEVSPDAVGPSHPMTFEELFSDEVFPDGVLPEMVDEGQFVTEGGAAMTGAGAGSGTGASVGAGKGVAGAGRESV